MARAINRILNPISTARAMAQSSGFKHFKTDFADRGTRFAIGALGHQTTRAVGNNIQRIPTRFTSN